MIHAYDKSYLSAAQKNLARMLDYLVNDLHYPLETAWQWFVTSELSARFEQGDCSVLVGLSGVELARAVLEQAPEAVFICDPDSGKISETNSRFVERFGLLARFEPLVELRGLLRLGVGLRLERGRLFRGDAFALVHIDNPGERAVGAGG